MTLLITVIPFLRPFLPELKLLVTQQQEMAISLMRLFFFIVTGKFLVHSEEVESYSGRDFTIQFHMRFVIFKEQVSLPRTDILCSVRPHEHQSTVLPAQRGR